MTRGHSGWMALLGAPHRRDLTDEQWNFIGPFLPELARRKDGRGRPWRENRAVFNGILWILRTGAPWADLPDRYPSIRHATAGFSSGSARACCGASSRSSPRHSSTKAIWICRKRLSTAASRPPSREEPPQERRLGGRFGHGTSGRTRRALAPGRRGGASESTLIIRRAGITIR